MSRKVRYRGIGVDVIWGRGRSNPTGAFSPVGKVPIFYKDLFLRHGVLQGFCRWLKYSTKPDDAEIGLVFQVSEHLNYPL